MTDDLRERVARALIVPLGHDPNADWERVYVGNGFEADGSLKALCLALADAAVAATAAHIAALTAERDAAIGDKGNAEQCARDGWEAAHRLLAERDAARAELARQQAGVLDMETITQALILAKLAQRDERIAELQSEIKDLKTHEVTK